MKKKQFLIVSRLAMIWKSKLFSTMRLTMLALLLTVFQSFAVSMYAQSTKLNLNMKNVAIKQVLNSIEEQTNFFFLYNGKLIDVDQKITVAVNNQDIRDALNQVLAGTAINYEIVDRQILLSNQETKTGQSKQIKIEGKVLDTNNVPLPGVAVVVKGTTNGMVTDFDGNFSFASVPSDATLVFSFVGMRMQEIAVAGRTTLKVVMQEEAIGLEEVVAVGYGIGKKLTLTGAVSSINSEQIKAVSTENISTNLAGKIPGLRITQRTGEPGAYSTALDIRGYGTPLVVIDGQERDVSDFVRLNPADVDQISVIKDASAAVYGVKAANGVILVTTKKGAVGKPSINYSGSYILSTPINMPETCSAYDYASLLTQSQVIGGATPTFSSEDLQKYKDGTLPSTDWYSVLAHKYTTRQTNNINVSGGTDRIKYFTSIGSIDENGIWKSDAMDYKRYNLRSSVTGKITDNLEAEVSIEGMLDQRNQPNFAAQGGFEQMWMHELPTTPVYANNNPDYLEAGPLGSNAFARLSSRCGYVKTENKSIQVISTLNYKVPFIAGLSAKFMYGYYSNDIWNKTWRQKVPLYSYDAASGTYNNWISENDPSRLTGESTYFKRTTTLLQLNYDKVFNDKHSIKASLVYEDRHNENDNLRASKEFSINLDQFFAGLNNPTVTSSNITENANKSFIGKLNYDYLSKYILEFGFNYGGSSKFPKGERWGFFPYTSVGWRISEEEFFKNNFPAITNLKLRGSWGLMGDDAASSFQFLTGYTYPSGNYVSNGKVVSGLGFKGIPNPNITWYTTNNKNIGIDATIRDGLINLQLDLFRRDRSGLLATRALTIPGTVGANLPQENLNKDMREGFEFVIGHSEKRGDFKYDVSFNITYTRGQNTYLERTPDANSYLNWRNNMTDRWTNIYYGYNYIGQFQSQEELNNSPVQDSQGNRTLLPGDLKYEDVNKDGLITSLDQVPIARGEIPDMNLGLNLLIRYKQFDLNMFFMGAANYMHSRVWYFRGPLPWNRNSLSIFTDNWHHENIYDVNSPWIPGRFPAARTQGTPPSNSWDSDFWLEDAQYIRLKNLELGYNFDKSLVSRLSIQNLRVYVSGFNLLTLCKMKDVDPEILADTSYPIMRDVTFGVNVSF